MLRLSARRFPYEIRRGYRPRLPLPIPDVMSRGAAHVIQKILCMLRQLRSGTCFAKPDIQPLRDREAFYKNALKCVQHQTKPLHYGSAELQVGH